MSLAARGIGLLRSWLIYRAIPWRAAQLRRFYRRFVPEGGLAFDVGAHAGSRVAAFRQLGARVVALEPQADFVWILRRRFGRDPGVTPLPQALGSEPGEQRLHISELTPTVSTLSTHFVQEAMAARSFRRVRWEMGPVVVVTTLDALDRRARRAGLREDRCGGFRAGGVAGPEPALACAVVRVPAGRARRRWAASTGWKRWLRPGRYRYSVSLGEQQRLLTPEGEGAVAMRDWLRALPVDAPSGDVHAPGWWLNQEPACGAAVGAPTCSTPCDSGAPGALNASSSTRVSRCMVCVWPELKYCSSCFQVVRNSIIIIRKNSQTHNTTNGNFVRQDET